MNPRSALATLARSLLASSIGVASFAPAVHADDKQACIAAAESGQDARSAGKLRDARSRFITCAADACPAVVRLDCARWLREVEESVPTVVVHATDGGAEIVAVRLFLDGNLVVATLDGSAIPLDAGAHRLRFESDGRPTVEQQIVLHEGEKLRRIEVAFSPAPAGDRASASASVAQPEAPAPETETRRVGTGVWVLGAFSVVALGTGTYLALTGRHDVTQLQGTCAPSCDASEVDSVRRRLIVAEVSLGVGIAAGVATITWALLDTRPRTTSASSSTGIALGLAPTPGGGTALVFGHF
ncbi:MAG: hypothetical protein NVSMB47_04120 [Polyangiales bacterium]